MPHSLPPFDHIGLLPTAHFPTRMQCFIFRNYGYIAPSVLADVLGCDNGTVLSLAADMGLPVPMPADPAWSVKGYITIIRANWHLCTYEQIAKLLGWSLEKLAYILREDDFLSIKLGNTKPDVPPITYTPLTDAEKAATIPIRDTVRAALERCPETARPFDFKPSFARAAANAKRTVLPAAGATSVAERIVYSYCALYGDTFADRALLDESFPDELLEAYAALGVTGVWTQAVLYTLTPYPFDETYSAGYETRLDGMRYLVDKLKKHGLKLFLYLNEPRSMPDSYFEKHPGLRGNYMDIGYSCLCVSTDEVRSYLYNAVKALCEAVPELGGFITITASENLSNCYSHAVLGSCKCPRCAKRKPSEVIADVNRLLYEGAAAANPDIRFIAWNWNWEPREEHMNENAIAQLPEGIGVMCVSEEGVTKTIGGTETRVIDYSISVEGPGDYALGVWQTAKQSGHAAYAKLQLGNTWEMAVVPCVPAFEKIYRHLRGILTRASIDGAMLGWTLGGFPSPTLTMAKCLFDGTASTLDEIYAVMFPGCNTAKLKEAFHILSDAFDEYPFHIHVAYMAPHLTGAANLLYDTPTHREATMVGLPYDDLDKWCSIYPRDTFIAQLDKLCCGWDEGVASLEAAAKETDCTALTDVLRYAKVCGCQFRAAYDQCVFVKRRDEEDIIDTSVIRREKELAEKMLRYVSEDASIGYESSNHYFFTRRSLLEKMIECSYLLRKYD